MYSTSAVPRLLQGRRGDVPWTCCSSCRRTGRPTWTVRRQRTPRRPSKKESVAREEFLPDKRVLRNPGRFKRSKAGEACALLLALGPKDGEDACPRRRLQQSGFNVRLTWHRRDPHVCDGPPPSCACATLCTEHLVMLVGASDAECGEGPALFRSIPAWERAVPGASRGLARSFHRG